MRDQTAVTPIEWVDDRAEPGAEVLLSAEQAKSPCEARTSTSPSNT